tara:strand:+ start:3214 stop:3540 length:327 start_codon:yes stop_codon:yes gene_type:complete
MVKLVRLSSGEELISKVDINEDSITLKNPAILIPAGREQLALGQWMPYASYEKGVEIKNEFVVFIVDAQDELKNQYNTSFGSGLVVPTAGAGGIQGAGIPAPDLKLTT